jgi:hypothetical protein
MSDTVYDLDAILENPDRINETVNDIIRKHIEYAERELAELIEKGVIQQKLHNFFRRKKDNKESEE